MFGIGSTELLLILVVALIVLGPRSLASVSRTLGKMVGEFRRVSTEFQRTLNVEAAQEEARERARNAASNDAQGAAFRNQEYKDGAETSDIPADSPLAQAIAKAKAQAGQASASNKNIPANGGKDA